MTDLSQSTQAASDWLADFASSLQHKDIDAAVALFDADSYWRDLVTFTWNICTQEGPEAIRRMLHARLADVQPANFQMEGQTTEMTSLVTFSFAITDIVISDVNHARVARLIGARCEFVETSETSRL